MPWCGAHCESCRLEEGFAGRGVDECGLDLDLDLGVDIAEAPFFLRAMVKEQYAVGGGWRRRLREQTELDGRCQQLCFA